MQNEQNNTKFYPAETTKKGYSCTVDYIQFGKLTWSKTFKSLKGQVLLGYMTWEEENPAYVSPEVYETLSFKNNAFTFKVITQAKAVYKD
jgi:hypothetical protein